MVKIELDLTINEVIALIENETITKEKGVALLNQFSKEELITNVLNNLDLFDEEDNESDDDYDEGEDDEEVNEEIEKELPKKKSQKEVDEEIDDLENLDF